ncbi:MAG: trehalose-6-phosphate synthase, partial [Deltaproteobacteria bacterium]|nr:trehalose-6-phosphate synthase [Deltaproteobacteria bacterium]
MDEASKRKIDRGFNRMNPPDSEVTAARTVLVLSNRLPFAVHRGPKGLEKHVSPGGLVSALEPVLRKHGGIWIGWPGLALNAGESLNGCDLPYQVQPVELSEEDVRRYYQGFSNRTLWPLLHSFPQNTQFDPDDFRAYAQVNQRFAEAAAQVAGPSDMIWIHDYHLMLAPSTLRALRPKATLGFFLHTPFPSYDIFRLLPWDQELLKGLLDCDLIGFHIESYLHNFLDCVEKRLGARVDHQRMLVGYGDRTIRVEAFPIGIDFALYEQAATSKPLVGKEPSAGQEPSANQEPSADKKPSASASTQSMASATRRSPIEPAAGKIILGVDRLDYTKGIPERIRAFEHFLELYPEQREQVTLLQVAVPSRSTVSEYQELKREIDELVGQVNGRFATARWSPIRYVYSSFERDELAVLY